MQGMRRFFLGMSAAVFVLSGITTAITTTSASASISPNPKLVGTYNVKVKLNPAFGGTKLSGQITLAGDGTWTGNVLHSLGCADNDKGSWLSTGTVLALSDLDPGSACQRSYGMTWMITVGTNGTLGSAAAPGYLNVPYSFNATWDAVPAPKVAPAPHTVSAISPSPKLVGTYNGAIMSGGGSLGMTITLNGDGTWTGSFFCNSHGSWLSSGKTIALSDDIGDCVTYGGSWMAAVKAGPSLGSVTKPGYVNIPYSLNGTWYAIHSSNWTVWSDEIRDRSHRSRSPACSRLAGDELKTSSRPEGHEVQPASPRARPSLGPKRFTHMSAYANWGRL
jgi:hypothetical protein